MTGNSRPVLSSQTGPHPRLLEAIDKHRKTLYKKPFADHNLLAFNQILPALKENAGRLRLDTGCGVGESTVSLAKEFPQDFIVGIDKSIHRLETHSRSLFDRDYPNYILVRGDLEDLWRLFYIEGIRFKAQYFFYPNPWPRPEHYLRRWPAHPVFPLAAQLSPEAEVRSNWEIYVEEFLIAWHQIQGTEGSIKPWNPPIPQTPFERKYLASGQNLWQGLCWQKIKAM